MKFQLNINAVLSKAKRKLQVNRNEVPGQLNEVRSKQK